MTTRVLHYGISSHLGGIETYLYKLFSNIDKKKFHFDFLTIGDDEVCFQREFLKEGSKVYTLTPRSDDPIKNRSDLNDLFKNNKFDIIHCHMNSLSYSLPIKMGLKYDIPVIVHSRNAQPPKSLKTKLLHEVNSYLLPKKNVEMLAVSDFAGEWMFGKKTNFTVINNGIDINKYRFNEESRRKIRNELSLEGQFCVIHVGAFRPQKNHMFLLETFCELLKSKPDSKLLLIGSGSLDLEINNKIEELGIKEKVVMLGNRDNVSDFLSAADVFLFPSLYEGFPNAVLEAQTTGLPCLISDTITKEVLINENCLTFPIKRTPEEWACKLLELPPYNNRLDGTKNIILKGLSVRAEVKKIENLYYSLKSLQKY